MCGIIGIVESRKQVDKNLLCKMRDTLIHRGPDDSGIWISSDAKIGFAHRRLSIIDLSQTGYQPMSDDEGKIWITCDGEVYNFQEIREELEKKGYRFKSRTDTEVVLNAYKEWGIDCLQKFNGVFAFGIYDENKKILFLARDRVGVKPIYYANYDGKLIFASELKAILKDPDFSKEIDLNALNIYLAYGYIPSDLCIFKTARKLPPAHALIYDIQEGEIKTWRYWEVLFGNSEKSEESLVEELEALIEDAVKLRWSNNIPIGAFLSGGVDSSLMVAMLSRISGTSVKTFSVGFKEQRYNELPYAKIVADYFGTQHTEIMVGTDVVEVLPELCKIYDEPFADSSMIPSYYLCSKVKEYIKIAFDGSGGDELFGGYSTYPATKINYFICKAVPKPLRTGIAEIAELLPEGIKGKRQLLRLRYDYYDAFIDRNLHSTFKRRFRQKILKQEALAELSGKFLYPELLLRSIMQSCKSDLINQLCYSNFAMYLPDDGIVKLERASMANSLVIRSPLLDHRIVEFSFGKLPSNLKVKRLKKKYLLKKLSTRMLPENLDLERKMGFAIPISEWFRGKLYKELREILFGSSYHFINTAYVEKLFEEHQNGIDHGGRLYILLVFGLWAEENLK